MKSSLLVSLLVVYLSSDESQAARILGLFPYKGASHFFVFQPLMEELARRGHAVDVVSHLPRKEPLANYTDISIINESDPPLEFVSFSKFETMKTSFLTNLMGLLDLSSGYEHAHSLPQVLALTNVSYDLVILEMFNSDVFLGIAHKIGAPVIGFSSCQMLPWTADSMGAPNDLGFVPNSIGDHNQDMNFIERLMNIVEYWMSRAFYRLVIGRAAQSIAEKYLGPLPDLSDIASNTSLLFVNSHFTLLGQRPLPQSVIEVGGINVRDPHPLPKDLEAVVNKSDGVIFFSMGSVLKASTLPPQKLSIFLNVFKSIGKTILWKRDEPLSNKYPYIVTRPWFPQRDILNNPKTELFIAHCGLLGVNEAVVSGVPLICIPMFGDQPMNAKFVSYSGIGITLDYHTLTEEKLKSAIKDILLTEKFKKRAAEVSAAYRDRPLSPLDTGVFWVEYLLRHGRQTFMTPFKQMPLLVKQGYDTLLAISMILVFVSSLFITAIRFSCSAKVKPKKEKQN